jgi:hypothetical protein|tara:strand:+ start:2255 stop:2641 length:387 start_codon:yes stop_codon:yes gene_type:complete
VSEREYEAVKKTETVGERAFYADPDEGRTEDKISARRLRIVRSRGSKKDGAIDRGLEASRTLGFASWVWMRSLTRSMGAVAVFAMEPETPPICEGERGKGRDASATAIAARAITCPLDGFTRGGENIK